MNSCLIRNIQSLVQVDEGDTSRPFLRGSAMQQLPSIEQAWLLVEGDRIVDFGTMDNCPERADQVVDATGRMVFPSWVDSHTHLVFAASREGEFVDRIKGLSYQEIAAKGGGILNSARRLQETPEEVLFEQAWQRLQEVRAMGTGAIEIKSGYGLSLEAELKMLRVIRRLKEASDLPIRASFLGAHALPTAFANHRQGYIDLLTKELLPRIADEQLADYMDVFCEKNFFSPAETDHLLEAGLRHGLKPKIHCNQFYSLGGVPTAIKHGAISVDHLEVVSEADIEHLLASTTIPTLLPTAPFFLNDHYPPARQMIDAGLGVALASDYNPGTTPSGKMAFVVSLACIKLRMTPEEALNAATINGAHALEWGDQLGSIGRGKLANLFLTKPMPSIAFLPYSFGANLVDQVMISGKLAS
ncbi:MAG: imidazolonepropionase [Bacteroidota bacterium]